MNYSPFPILEFDPDRRAKLCPEQPDAPLLPEKCVITFFREALEELVREQNLSPIAHLHSEIVDLPIYRLERRGEPVCVALPFATSPGAVCTLEELHALGAEKFVVCGGAGCLTPGLELGRIILPVSAVRDEGASYHYLEPGREAACPAEGLAAARRGLAALGVPVLEGKTWTTDALYRETEGKIARRAAEGCLTVEMECAGFFAAAQFHGLPLAQLLYAGDDLSADTWDSRGWDRQHTVRRNLLETALDLVTYF